MLYESHGLAPLTECSQIFFHAPLPTIGRMMLRRTTVRIALLSAFAFALALTAWASSASQPIVDSAVGAAGGGGVSLAGANVKSSAESMPANPTPKKDGGQHSHELALQMAKEEAPSSLIADGGPNGAMTFEFRDVGPSEKAAGFPAIVFATELDANDVRAQVAGLKEQADRIEGPQDGWPDGTVAGVVDRRPHYVQVMFVQDDVFFNLASESARTFDDVEAWAHSVAARLASSHS